MSIEKIRDNCTGCTTCEKICPTNAIAMEKDALGYLYPHINADLCTNCNLCEKRCPVISLPEIQNLKGAYYGRADDLEIVKRSSSGGVFSLLANNIMKDRGVVFGAVFDKKTQEVTYKSTQEVDIDELRRSKYVECKVGDSFKEVEVLVQQGKLVLFCGMPCHIAGLKMYLKKEYDNLYTCDFICGGATSGEFFDAHIKYLEKKYKSRVANINFRPKLYGWDVHSIVVEFENGKEYKNYAYLDTYFRGFVYEQVLTRDTCKSCAFRNNHASDIILADFWGYKQRSDIKNDNKGISLIVTNSDKGEALLKESIKKQSNIKEIDLKYAEYNFKPKKIKEGTQRKRNEFENNYKELGFENTAKKVYMNKKYKFLIKQLVKRIIRGRKGFN